MTSLNSLEKEYFELYDYCENLYYEILYPKIYVQDEFTIAKNI